MNMRKPDFDKNKYKFVPMNPGIRGYVMARRTVEATVDQKEQTPALYSSVSVWNSEESYQTFFKWDKEEKYKRQYKPHELAPVSAEFRDGRTQPRPRGGGGCPERGGGLSSAEHEDLELPFRSFRLHALLIVFD